MSRLLGRLFAPKATAFHGIIGPLFAFMCVIIAILVSPWFTWTGNALSDLGHPSRSSSIYFNIGLIVGGVITALFVIGLGLAVGFGLNSDKKTSSESGKGTVIHARLGLKPEKNIGVFLATLLLFVGSIALACIGLFPESMPPWHFIFSVTMFASIALSLLTFGVSYVLKSQTRKLGAISFLFGILSTSTWVVYWVVYPWSGVAVPEALSAVTVYVWVLIMCFALISGKGTKSK